MAKKKKRKGSGFFSNLLLILCILIFCVAAWKLWGYYKHYHGGKKEYEQLRQYVKENADPDEQKTKKEKDKCPVTVDFEALAKVNPDVRPGSILRVRALIIRSFKRQIIRHTFIGHLKERIVLLVQSF